MNVPRAITGANLPHLRRVIVVALSAAAAVVCGSLGLLLMLSLRESRGGVASNAAWARHRDEIRKLPDELYHRDRFRAIRGRIADREGKAISGALVRCVKVESLVELARAGVPTAAKWTVPIEAEVTTGADGIYEFPHLGVGARTFFYSAPGRDLAPAIKDLVVVQDGLGAQLNVTLARPAALRVKVEPARMPSVVLRGADRLIRDRKRQSIPRRLYLIPHRWWPTLPVAAVPKVEGSKEVNTPHSPLPTAHSQEVEFRGLGGPLRKGLIAAPGPEESAPLRIVGRYDLDQSPEVVITGIKAVVSQFDLPEAAGIESWRLPMRASHRLFYAAMSPIALFWPVVADDQPLWSTQPTYLLPPSPLLQFPLRGKGTVRGFAPHPFLPVLVESRTGGSWLGWTSEASEYEVSDLPAGAFRVRALDLFGRVTFASGLSVREGSTVEPARLWAKVDLDEADSREVLGFVSWESGLPAENAAVFMQNTYNFRKFVRRVETNKHGYFRFSNVPGDEPYFIFAVPPGDSNSMRSFEYFSVGSLQREVWRALELHPHRVMGDLHGLARIREAEAPSESSKNTLLQFVRIEGKAESIVWSFRAEPSGKFVVANVPHGRYRVQISQKEGRTDIRSLPFEVGDGQSETIVRWSSR